MSGAFNATVGQPAKDMAAKATAPIRDAYREGSAYGIRATSGSAASSPASTSRSSGTGTEPDWAKRIRRREQMNRAGTVASQSIREGDRGASSEGPDLNPDT
jgi:type IV secretion system protein TrbL